MKRTTVVLAGSIAGLFLIAGCGATPKALGQNNSSNSSGSSSSNSSTSSSGSSSNTLSWSGTSSPKLKGQTITVMWNDPNQIHNQRMKWIQQFEKQTGIHVKVVDVPYNGQYEKVTTAAMAGSSNIDIAPMDTIWAGQFYKGNVAVDLSKVIPKSVQSKFTKESLTSVEYNGHLMAVPWFSSSKHFYYNTKMFKKAGISGPPKTYTEFLKDSEIIQKKLGGHGVYASAWSWKQAESLTCDYVGFLGAFGGQFFQSNGQPAFQQGGGLKALQFMQKLMKSGTVDPASLQWTEGDVARAFEAGKIAMMSNWEEGSNLNNSKNSVIKGDWKVSLLPGEGSVKSATCTGSEGLAILKTSKHKEAALAFLKWMASPYYQINEYKAEGQMPSIKSVYPQLEKSDKLGVVKAFLNQYQYGINRPNAPGYVQWSDTLQASLHNALNGSSAQQQLQTAAKKIQKAINSAS